MVCRITPELDGRQQAITEILFAFHAFLSSADFFSKSTFSKNLSRNTISAECQTVLIQIRPIQTVCKGYQQMTLVGKELRKAKSS